MMKRIAAVLTAGLLCLLASCTPKPPPTVFSTAAPPSATAASTAPRKTVFLSVYRGGSLYQGTALLHMVWWRVQGEGEADWKPLMNQVALPAGGRIELKAKASGDTVREIYEAFLFQDEQQIAMDIRDGYATGSVKAAPFQLYVRSFNSDLWTFKAAG
ncbi:MAG: hypothetical protein LBJ11_01565 [Oscillospiraceae bacterium]|jgi:hypothetical protein|nr:hypothetical protein [Oscillospiraceae bacterium]